MKTRIALKGLHFHSFHGFYEEERKMGNPFVVHMAVTIDDFDTQDDNIKDTVNYEDLYNICASEMKKTQKLLETVALNIINRLKSEFPQVIDGEVTIEKVGPQLGGKVDKAVITMEF